MGYEFYIRILERDGTVRVGNIQPLKARYTNSLTGQESLAFDVNEQTPNIANIQEYDIAEVYIRNKGLGVQTATGGFVRDFVGIIRGGDGPGTYIGRQTNDDNITSLTFNAPNIKHILSWRYNQWKTGVADRSTFAGVASETVLKTLVQYNCTVDATIANDRLREGDLAPGMLIDINIETDGGNGVSLNKSFAQGNLLGILQRIQPTAGGDWSVDFNGGVWSFNWHTDQLGEDKTSGNDRVVWSLENKTMVRPRLKYKIASGTVAIAGGQGREDNRVFNTEVQGPDYSAANDIELFVNATNLKTVTALDDICTEKLDDTRLKGQLEFDVLQTQATFYSPINIANRATYKLGDLGIASYGLDFRRKVVKVTVDWQNPTNTEALKIDIDTQDVVIY